MMATRFPGALDRDPEELPDNIADSDNLNSPNHATVHNNVNGAVLQIEEKLGTGDTTPSSGAVLIGTGTGTSAWDTTPTFVDDVTIPEGDLILGSTAVTSTAAELNLLDGSTAGTVVASKAVVVDANKDISSFRNITATGDVTMPEGDLILGSTAVTATANEINVLDGVTGGTVAASKGVVVDANKDVTGFRNVTATGDVTIPDGDLILGSTAVTSTAAELNILDGSLDWTAWTPTLTNITLGNGTVNAHYARLGDVIFFEIEFLCGSTTSFSSTSMQFEMPVDYAGELQFIGLGTGWVRPNGSTIYPITVIGIQSSNNIVPYYEQNYTSVQSIAVRGTLPISWTSSGTLFMAGSYRA
jgi:hypothetical protein